MTPLDLETVRDPTSLQRRIQELSSQLRAADPSLLAAWSGSVLDPAGSCLHTAVMGQPVLVTLPDYRVVDAQSRQEAHVYTQAMMLYHLTTTRGAPVTGRWVSFRELPDGGFYHLAFQGYTGREIVRAYGEDLPAFCHVAEQLGGRWEAVGNAGYAFDALPRVPLLIVYWLGEENLPSSAQVLFDASAGLHLPVDACALLGSILARRLIAGKQLPR